MSKLLMGPKRDLPSRIAREVVTAILNAKPLSTSYMERLIRGVILYEREQCAREAEVLGASQVAGSIRGRPEGVTQLQLDAQLPSIIRPN